MSKKELHEAAGRGDMDEVKRLLDEEGVDVNSKDERVSVCVLCLLILVLFGIEWIHCSHLLFYQRPLECGASTAGSKSEPNDQELRK